VADRPGRHGSPRLPSEGIGYTEGVDVIGNEAFFDFVEDLERLEELESGKFEVGKDKIIILTSQSVLPDKSAYDIAIPQLSPVLQRQKFLSEERCACPPAPAVAEAAR
jgi:hypothetical protein